MNYSEFKQKSIKQDKRNLFQENTNVPDGIPESLVAFFRVCDPIDVEVTIAEETIKFFSAEKLNSLQEEYKLPNGRFVFATCNGDPIYIFNDKVYSCYPDSEKVEDELKADSFDDYLKLIES